MLSMLSLIETIRSKKSYTSLQPTIDKYYNISNHLENNIPVALDEAELYTSGFDLSGISQDYDMYYESLKANYEQCKDSVERILLVTTRVGVLEASDIDIFTPLNDLFDYMRKITSIELDWDKIFESISTINIEVTAINSSLDKTIQESHILSYNVIFLIGELRKLNDNMVTDKEEIAPSVDILKRYQSLLGFLCSTSDSNLSDLPQLQDEISLL